MTELKPETADEKSDRRAAMFYRILGTQTRHGITIRNWIESGTTNYGGLLDAILDVVEAQPARRPSPSISDGEVEALIAEAADFTERMTGQPWACELIDRLASILAASKARSTTEVEVTAEARCKRLEAQVEQAFRDGLAYATNVVVTDADEAWRTSRARLALQENTNGR